MLPSPLEGLRVLDCSRVLSGPFAGRMLRDLGADVVKLEPPDGDVSRVWGQVRHGLSGFYTQQNAGKRNVCVDLKHPDGVAVARRLAAAADVLIENFRPGVLDRLGLGWDVLSEANPGLIMLSISGFGQDGPHSQRQAYAPVLHAEAGLIARQAAFDGNAPTDPMLSIADFDAGLHGLVAILAALHLRSRTGVGQRIDLAMLDAMLVTDDYAHHLLDEHPLLRLGGEVWEATGGPILIAGEFRNTWRQLSTVQHVPDPTPPGAELAEKIRCRRSAVAEWVAAFDDRDELKRALLDADLAYADVRAPEQVFAAPTVAHRGTIAEVDDRAGGTRRVVQSPYRFSAAESGIRGPAPYRGEHNAEVLGEWLGADEAELDRLGDSGAISAEERPER